jgi:hypothetical protein
MGRYYSGDIEGKFWFGVQSSDDASSLGGYPEYVYDDGEEIEYDEDEREEEDAIGLFYQFGPDQEDDLSEAIYGCKKELGEFLGKLDKFFEVNNNSYNDSSLALVLEVDEVKVRRLLVYYARLKFGEKIQNCLNENGQCNFTADLY